MVTEFFKKLDIFLSGTKQIRPVEQIYSSQHAQRMSEINKEKHSEWKKICLFMGKDISSLLIVNQLIPKLRAQGFEPMIFLVEPNPSKKSEAEHETIQEIRDYQNLPISKIIRPYLKSRLQTGESVQHHSGPVSLDFFDEKYNITPRIIPPGMINDEKLVELIEQDQNIVGAISIRPYQYFKNDIIKAFRNKKFSSSETSNIEGFFWNIHPGTLPRLRGIHTPLIAMTMLKDRFGWSLHEVHYDDTEKHKGVDFGNFIDFTTLQIDYNKQALNLYFDFVTPATVLIEQKIDRLCQLGVLQDIKPQETIIEEMKGRGESGASSYYSYAEAVDAINKWPNLHNCLRKKFQDSAHSPNLKFDPKTSPVIADITQTSQFYAQSFFPDNVEERQKLEQLINLALSRYETTGTMPHFDELNSNNFPHEFGYSPT